MLYIIRIWMLWLFSLLCVYTGVDFLVRFFRSPTLSILTFHRIGNQRDPLLLTISSQYFEKVIGIIKNNRKIVGLTQGLALLTASGHENMYAITFDDGYADNLVLGRYATQGIPSVVYLATNCIGGEILWPFKLSQSILGCQKDVLDLRNIGLKQYPLMTLGDREKTVLELNDWLKTFPHQKMLDFVDKICASCELLLRVDIIEERMLTWCQVRVLSEAGVEIGGHTANHTILTNVSLSDASGEIKASAKAVNKFLPVSKKLHFAYPNGKRTDYNRSLVDCVKNTGFSSAVTTVFGVNTKNCNHYELKRIPVTEASFLNPFGRFSGARFLSETSGAVALIKELLMKS